MRVTRPDPSSNRLARAIAERLAGALPAGLALEAVGPTITLWTADGSFGCSAAAAILEGTDAGRRWDDRMSSAVIAILGGVQDCVMACTSEQWPVDTDRCLAMPDARIADGILHTWFGATETSAALTLLPIRIDAIIPGPME